MSEPQIVGNFSCECQHPIIGARVSGTPLRCERCRGLVQQIKAQGGLSQRWREYAEPNSASGSLGSPGVSRCADELDAAKLRIEEAVKALPPLFRVDRKAVLKIIREVL